MTAELNEAEIKEALRVWFHDHHGGRELKRDAVRLTVIPADEDPRGSRAATVTATISYEN